MPAKKENCPEGDIVHLPLLRNGYRVDSIDVVVKVVVVKVMKVVVKLKTEKKVNMGQWQKYFDPSLHKFCLPPFCPVCSNVTFLAFFLKASLSFQNIISYSLGPQMEYSHIVFHEAQPSGIQDFNELNEGNMIIFHEWTKWITSEHHKLPIVPYFPWKTALK